MKLFLIILQSWFTYGVDFLATNLQYFEKMILANTILNSMHIVRQVGKMVPYVVHPLNYQRVLPCMHCAIPTNHIKYDYNENRTNV